MSITGQTCFVYGSKIRIAAFWPAALMSLCTVVQRWQNAIRAGHRLFPLPFPPPPSIKKGLCFCGNSYSMVTNWWGPRAALLAQHHRAFLVGPCVLAGRGAQRQAGTSPAEVKLSLGKRRQRRQRQEAWRSLLLKGEGMGRRQQRRQQEKRQSCRARESALCVYLLAVYECSRMDNAINSNFLLPKS